MISRRPGAAGDLDRIGGALVGMDPPEDDQVLTAGRGERQRVEVDPVVHRRDVVQLGHPVGVGDGHVGRSAAT